jgi:glycosyltransferase involved in cell wall biosynthesis
VTSITVAVATCGRPEALARCLDALAGGSLTPSEVIVVDQAPTAASTSALARLGSLPHRQISQARLGLSASRNGALDAASSDFLAVTDDDCVPDRDWLRQLAAAIDAGATAVAGAVHPLTPPTDGLYAASLREDSTTAVYRQRVIPWRVGTGGNFAGSVTTLTAAGGWDERLGAGSAGRAGEDIELIDRLLGLGVPITTCPSAIVRHELLTTERRLATRWSYGYGIGAFFGLRARRFDVGIAPMAFDYVRMHAVAGALAVGRRSWFDAGQHVRALGALGPGVLYGLRAGPEPRGMRGPDE